MTKKQSLFLLLLCLLTTACAQFPGPAAIELENKLLKPYLRGKSVTALPHDMEVTPPVVILTGATWSPGKHGTHAAQGSVKGEYTTVTPDKVKTVVFVHDKNKDAELFAFDAETGAYRGRAEVKGDGEAGVAEAVEKAVRADSGWSLNFPPDLLEEYDEKYGTLIKEGEIQTKPLDELKKPILILHSKIAHHDPSSRFGQGVSVDPDQAKLPQEWQAKSPEDLGTLVVSAVSTDQVGHYESGPGTGPTNYATAYAHNATLYAFTPEGKYLGSIEAKPKDKVPDSVKRDVVLEAPILETVTKVMK